MSTTIDEEKIQCYAGQMRICIEAVRLNRARAKDTRYSVEERVDSHDLRVCSMRQALRWRALIQITKRGVDSDKVEALWESGHVKFPRLPSSNLLDSLGPLQHAHQPYWGKTKVDCTGDVKPEPKDGFSVWVEDSIWYTAPTVDASKYGTHDYYSEKLEWVVPGECRCGCKMGLSWSVGTVDPFGLCPCNPKKGE